MPEFLIEQILLTKNICGIFPRKGIVMKRVRYAVLMLENGDSRVVRVKTTTEEYMWNLIDDLNLPSRVTGWEFLN